MKRSTRIILSLIGTAIFGIWVWSHIGSWRQELERKPIVYVDDFSTAPTERPFVLPWNRPPALDPYAVTPVTYLYRPILMSSSPVFETELIAPPRLLHTIYWKSSDVDGHIVANAFIFSALLPNLELRTPSNQDREAGHGEHHFFDTEDVLEVQILNGQELGNVPDYWFRQFVGCGGIEVPADNLGPGLSINPRQSSGPLIACLAADSLPDSNYPLIHCDRDVYTRKPTRCVMELVIPWSSFGSGIAKNYRAARPGLSEHGLDMKFAFPAKRLSEWRRMRELSVCLVEAVVPQIEQIKYPSRDAALCEAMKTALIEKKESLVPPE